MKPDWKWIKISEQEPPECEQVFFAGSAGYTPEELTDDVKFRTDAEGFVSHVGSGFWFRGEPADDFGNEFEWVPTHWAPTEVAAQ